MTQTGVITLGNGLNPRDYVREVKAAGKAIIYDETINCILIFSKS